MFSGEKEIVWGSEENYGAAKASVSEKDFDVPRTRKITKSSRETSLELCSTTAVSGWPC